MYLWVRAYGYGSAVSYYIAVFFFLLLMIMGNIVLFSLFTAILLNNFEGDDDEEEEEEEGKTICMSFKEAFGKRKKVKKIVDINGIEIDVEAEEAGKKEMQQIKEEAEAFDHEASMMSDVESAHLKKRMDRAHKRS